MLIGIAAFLFVTGLFIYIGINAAVVAKGRQKFGAWLLAFAGWAAIVACAANLAGFWGRADWPSEPFPNWIAIPLCVLMLTFPFAIPLIMGMREIWRDGGKNPDFALPFFDEETGIGVLYAVSLGLSFYLTDFFGIHYGWSFPISLPVLFVLFIAITGFVWCICWLMTHLARRFSPASKRSNKRKIK